jgi:hypothetical protein
VQFEGAAAGVASSLGGRLGGGTESGGISAAPLVGSATNEAQLQAELAAVIGSLEALADFCALQAHSTTVRFEGINSAIACLGMRFGAKQQAMSTQQAAISAKQDAMMALLQHLASPSATTDSATTDSASTDLRQSPHAAMPSHTGAAGLPLHTGAAGLPLPLDPPCSLTTMAVAAGDSAYSAPDSSAPRSRINWASGR